MEKSPQLFDVCIVCALPEEARAFLEVTQQQCESAIEERMSLRYQSSYRFATIKNDKGEPLNLHISWLPRYGPQEMTLHLSRVLEECQPRIVIMTGICAGDSQHVQLGDLIVAERTFTYDNGKFTLDEHGRSVHLHDTLTYQLDANILQFLGLFDDWKPLVARLKRPPTAPERSKGRTIACYIKAMASGSAVRTDNPFEDVRTPVRGTVAIDMEGAAFGLVMSHHPLIRWLVVKGVCDYADQTKNDAYHDYAAHASALYALGFIRAYVTNERLPRLDGPSPSSRAGPSEVWNIPFARNPFFTGRDRELTYLHTQLQQSHTATVGQPQAISGLGGIGKTQLAVEYAYRHKEEYQHVLWTHAESVEALTSSFTEIAHLLDLPEKDAEEQEITIRVVKRWLQRQGGWLLILNNADTPDLLPAFLPPTISGHLLITTRAADLSAQIAGLAHSLVVETFSDEQGALFLLHRSDLLASDAALDQAEVRTQQLALIIARELGGLPLALDQAGAYLNATGSSLIVYQQIYQQHRAQLLTERRGADHSEPVATTWNISFQHVEQQNPAAADLLRLCAFLAPDAIPEEILTKGAEELGSILAPVAADPFLLSEAIESLRAYSLIARDPLAQTLTVHRLVQVVLRDSLAAEIQHQWMQRAVHAVAAAFPKSSDFADWPPLERLLPHALTCAAWIEQASLATPEAAHLLVQAGYYLNERARYEEAEQFYQRALAIREGILGTEHPDTATALNNLGRLSTSQGRYEEAEQFYLRALAIRERVLGSEHPDSATTLNNLGRLSTSQGKYEEAEQFYQRALAIRKRVLGSEHPDTAASFIHLGTFYYSQGKYKEAEPLYQRALAIFEETRGVEHFDTAASLNSLGTLYLSQRRYREAKPLYQRALAIFERIRGAEHPNTAGILINLGALYYSQNRYKQAEQFYQRALVIFEQVLGPDYPDTAIILTNLGGLYYSQGRYKEAEPLLKRALVIRERVSNTDHPDIAGILTNLGRLYTDQGKYEEAEPLYQRALAGYEQIRGAEHPDKSMTLIFYSVLLWKTKRKLKAIQLIPRISQVWMQQRQVKRPPSTG